MSGNAPRPEQSGCAHGVPLVPPPPTRDLPAGRHEFHKERLMALIDHDTQTGREPAPTPVPTSAPARRPRRWVPRLAFALPALAAVVAGVVTATVVLRDEGAPTTDAHRVTEPAQYADPRAGTPAGLDQLVNKMVLVAGTRDTTPVRAGQYVYVKSKATNFFIKENADTGERTPVQWVLTRQVWNSLDGRRGWLMETGTDTPPGGITLDSDVEPSLGSRSYELLASLPTDPDALLARIYRETEGQGNGPDSQAFTTVGDLLGESYPPKELYAALYQAAAKIPGVLVVDDAVDAAGRHGIALARVDETGMREELIFDRVDFTFLGGRSVATRDMEDMKAGTVRFSSAVLERAIVDEMKQVPVRAG